MTLTAEHREALLTHIAWCRGTLGPDATRPVYCADAAEAALARLDALEAEVAALGDLLADAALDRWDLAERGAALERKAVLAEVDALAFSYEPPTHSSALSPLTNAARGALRGLAFRVRARGSLAPPLPWERLSARVALLEGALAPFASAERSQSGRAGSPYRYLAVTPEELEAARRAREENP